MNVQDAEQHATDFGVGTSAGHEGDGTPSMTLRKIKGIFMIFMFQTYKTLTIDSKAWIQGFKRLMNRLKLFRIKSLSCSMERKTEEKQSVDLSKQPIVKPVCQGFIVFYFCISLF